jgi:hypothetical protein
MRSADGSEGKERERRSVSTWDEGTCDQRLNTKMTFGGSFRAWNREYMLDKRDMYRAVSLLQRPQQLMTTVLLMLSYGMPRVTDLKFSTSSAEQLEGGGSGM